MQPGVVVTGIGIISAIGNGTEETLTSLFNHKSGIGPFEWLGSIHKGIYVAEVKFSNSGLSRLACSEFDPVKYTRNTLLALIATRQAVDSSGWSVEKGANSGLIMATTVGGMDYNEHHYKSLLSGNNSNSFAAVLDSSDTTEKVAARFGISHNITTISTACSSSANSIMLGARLIRNRKLNSVLAGGSDALTKFTINGFKGLELLSAGRCSPFDQKRDGLNIGEGAAVLLLESEETADMSKAICRISGYANINEAYHQTSSSPDGTGAYLAMVQCLENAGLNPEDIGYINAHGTGTEVNDLAESVAICRLFGEKTPPVSSTKTYTGHTLGAAGAVEAVISILALQKQVVWPALNISEKMPEALFDLPSEVVSVPLKHVMSNSFGFGGNNTSLIFSII